MMVHPEKNLLFHLLPMETLWLCHMIHVFGVDVNSLIKVKTAKLHVYQCETGPDTWTT